MVKAIVKLAVALVNNAHFGMVAATSHGLASATCQCDCIHITRPHEYADASSHWANGGTQLRCRHARPPHVRLSGSIPHPTRKS